MAESAKPSMTYPQGKYLFVLTGLKFWEPETLPPPGIKQATILIDGIKNFVDKTPEAPSPAELIDAIQIWFPSFTDTEKIHFRYFKKRKGSENTENCPPSSSKGDEPSTDGGGGNKPEPEEEKPSAHRPATSRQKTPKSEPKPEPQPQKPKPATSNQQPAETKGAENIESLINAGIRNIWMVGPAGCGKTTICQQVGENMDIPVTVIPCGAGTSATTFLGYKYPEREATPFVSAFSQPGIIVLDEFTALEAQVAQVVNSALANNQLSATTGTFQRHPDCTIIATSNTFGHGADRMYVSNNQLDASTIDRFACGIIEMDYSAEYENQYDPEVVTYVRRLREIINRNGLRKTASTRNIINACMLKANGIDWKASLTANWSTDERKLI